jgi:cytochrome c oxidase cbb3-type subunit IV
MDYEEMRHFADSWALLALFVYFIGVVIFAFRPGSRKHAENAASIPFKED